MICQKCKSATASICITQVVDAHKMDIYLCQNCANETAAATLKAALGFLNAVPGNLAFGGEKDTGDAQADNLCCQECGMTFTEIQKGGKLGCAGCYSAFRTQLRPIITRIHRSAQHRGKSPSGEDAPKTASTPDMNKGTGINEKGESIFQAEKVYGGFNAKNINDHDPHAAEPAASRIGILKAALAEVIRNEEYEKAAEIRDQIKELENI